MSVTPGTILKTAAKITAETFLTLGDILTDPSSAHDYCDAVGVPPFVGGGEWTTTVQQIRDKADAADNPEQWAEMIDLGAKVIDGLQHAIAGSAPNDPGALESAIVKIVVPVLLEVTRRHSPGLHTVLALAFFTDQRIQDSFPQGLFASRWYATLGGLATTAGWAHADTGEPPATDSDNVPVPTTETRVDWAPIVTDSVAIVTTIAANVFKSETLHDHLIRFWYGFDHPPLEEFEAARALARHAFTMLLTDGTGTITAADFDGGILRQPAAQAASPLGIGSSSQAPLGITLVPIPSTEDSPTKLYVQVHGEAHIDEPLRAGFRLKVTNGATFGVLTSSDGVETIGNVSFQAEIARQWPTEPADEHAAIEFRANRVGIGADIDVDGPRAWLRVEKGELAINGGSWIDDFLPRLRLTFDVSAEASVQNGLRFTGGAGGAVLIPINQRIPIVVGSVRIEAIQVKVALGDEDGVFSFRLEGTVNLTLELLSVLTLHVEGLGARFAVGPAPKNDGNLAGVAGAGWSTAIPHGAGLEINVLDKIVGGGALLYDEAARRLSGAFELKLFSKLVLKALGIYQQATDDTPESWLLIASLQFPQTAPTFTLQGIGALYGSNRTTDPDAFLAGITTGDLDAVLFPDDPIGKASQYLAALERCFPTKADASVMGVAIQIAALAGRITLDLGLLLNYESGSLARVYVVAQFVALTRPAGAGQTVDPTKQPVYVLADGVAIYDTRTSELNIRIALRNSHIWKGELTGGASLFHGSPQADGGTVGTYVTIGGFHPDYVPPGPKVFVPPRLQLALSKGDHLKLQVQTYVAYTPGAIHLGLSGQIEARLHGFGIRGSLGFDLLAGFDWQFALDLHFSIELMVGSHSLAAVSFSGSLVGLSPTILSGKASVSFLFFSISVSGSLTIHEDEAPDASIDITATVQSAIADPANWDAGGVSGVTLVDRQRDGVWLSPTAALRMAQPIVPLGVPIERYGSARLAAPQTYAIERVTVGSKSPAFTPVPGEFALGMYLDLSPEEKLASRGYEARPAGVELDRPLVAGGVVDTSDDFEEVLVDPEKRPDAPAQSPPFVVIGVFTVDAEAAPVLRVTRERFSVVDDGMNTEHAPMSYFEAHASRRSSQRIVPEFEVVP